MTEQVPDPDSRITLSNRKDRFGMPLSRIAWKVNEAEERSIRRTAELVASEVTGLGYAPPKLYTWVTIRTRFRRILSTSAIRPGQRECRTIRRRRRQWH